jgi:hypothetical protein
MMTHLWVYDGALDEGGSVLRLDAEGPAFIGEGMANYQDLIEFVSDDHRVLRSRTPGPGGEWVEFMTAHYGRTRYGGRAREDRHSGRPPAFPGERRPGLRIPGCR